MARVADVCYLFYMRYAIAISMFVAAVGMVSANEGFEASRSQTQSSSGRTEQEAFDMDAAEDRWVTIGSRFFLLLIIVLLIKSSLDKRKASAAPRQAPQPGQPSTRRPPSRR